VTAEEEREQILQIIGRHYSEQARKGMFGARAREVLEAIVDEINRRRTQDYTK
jgi:hypothetical protein